MAHSKSGVRRKGREFALQMLFQSDMGRQPPADVRGSFWSHREPVEADVQGFADDLFRAAADRWSDIDALIQQHAQNWRMERMSAVDRNILRLAVYEMTRGGTPPPVTIDEALELARKFSNEESVQFVNGVLDAVRREMP